MPSREREKIRYPAAMRPWIETAFFVQRCDLAQSAEALALAAKAWPEAERTAYYQSVQQAVDSGRAESVVLLSGCRDGQVIAAQIGQVLPGRAAVVWPPQFAETCEAIRRGVTAASLGREMATALKRGGAKVAQALVVADDPESASWLAVGGLSYAADLLYLCADVDAEFSGNSKHPHPGPLPEGEGGEKGEALPFELAAFRPDDTQRLVDVIQRTYEGTLDCPKIDGLRETADVIVGYQAVGVYRPDLWFFVREENRDVGCLLINVHPDVRHAEIVYLAVVPEVRGRGWGLRLALQAIEVARASRCERAVLAVDAANLPALALYRAAGFQTFDTRGIWLRTFHDVS